MLGGHQLALEGIEPKLNGYTIHGAGVAIFFAISGYLVTQSWRNDPHVLRFAARRFLRVWPGLAICVGLLSLGTYAYSTAFTGVEAFRYRMGAEAFLANALLVRFDWYFFQFPNQTLDASLWTIPYEATCYLLLAVVGSVLALPPRLGALLAVCLGGIAVWQGLSPEEALEHLPNWWVYFGLMFLAGVAMNLAPRRGYVLVALAVPWFPQLVVCMAAAWIGQQSWKGARSAGRFGDFSYGLYLWAWPMTNIGLRLYGHWGVLWSLPATFALAWLSWNLVESPALSFKPKARSHEME